MSRWNVALITDDFCLGVSTGHVTLECMRYVMLFQVQGTLNTVYCTYCMSSSRLLVLYRLSLSPLSLCPSLSSLSLSPSVCICLCLSVSVFLSVYRCLSVCLSLSLSILLDFECDVVVCDRSLRLQSSYVTNFTWCSVSLSRAEDKVSWYMSLAFGLCS